MGAGGHEELYFVVQGSARFTIADEHLEAPAGTMLRVPVGVNRAAVATESDTTVLVIGGKPGAALPVAPFEHWYAAQAAVNVGDYTRAAAIASEVSKTGLSMVSSTISSPATTRSQAITPTRCAICGSRSSMTRAHASGRLKTMTWSACVTIRHLHSEPVSNPSGGCRCRGGARSIGSTPRAPTQVSRLPPQRKQLGGAAHRSLRLLRSRPARHDGFTITLSASRSFIARYPSGTSSRPTTRSKTRPGSMQPSRTSSGSSRKRGATSPRLRRSYGSRSGSWTRAD